VRPTTPPPTPPPNEASWLNDAEPAANPATAGGD